MLGLRVDPIYFLVTETLALEDPEDPMSDPEGDVEAEVVGEWIDAFQPCPITSFSSAVSTMASLGEQNVKQMTAHEVFHCVQQFNFKPQHDASGSDWWSEGTAEFFGASVYPCGNAEHGYAAGYNPDTRVFGQDYANVALFQDLSERSGGERGILDLIRGMTTRDGGAAQQAALAGYSGISNKFHRFGKDFIDDAVPDCGPSARMPVTSDGGAIQEIGDSGSVEIEAMPFTIWRQRIKLKKGRIYTIRKNVTSGNGLLSVREEDMPGEWSSMPTRITSPCDEETILQLMATTTPSGRSPYRITLEFESTDDPDTEGCEACVDTGRRDACIVGTWAADSSDIERWLRRTLSANNSPDMSIEVNSFAGAASFTAVSEEGRMTGALEGILVKGRYISRSGRETRVIRFTFEGGGQTVSTWSTDRAEQRLYVCTEGSTVAFTQTMVFDGRSMTVPIPVSGGGDSAAEFEYRCGETSLTITHRTPGLPDQVYSANRIR